MQDKVFSTPLLRKYIANTKKKLTARKPVAMTLSQVPSTPPLTPKVSNKLGKRKKPEDIPWFTHEEMERALADDNVDEATITGAIKLEMDAEFGTTIDTTNFHLLARMAKISKEIRINIEAEYTSGEKKTPYILDRAFRTLAPSITFTRLAFCPQDARCIRQGRGGHDGVL